jgi:DHA1 family multidrug resistance protein-like MFS transporter
MSVATRVAYDADPGMSGLSSEPWRRNVWALTLTVFISFVGFQFFSPFLPLYIRDLGVTDPAKIALWSGLQAAVTPAMSGILSPLFGRLADRFGRKMMLIRSLVGFVVIVAAMGLVTSVEQLFIARLVMGLFAGFTPMVMALATTSAPRDKVPAAIGMVQSAQLLSVAVGPAIGGYVASHFGIRYAFFATAGLCAVALLGLIVLFQEVSPGAPGAPRAPAPRLPLRRIFQYPHFPTVVALLFIAQFLDRGLALLIPLQVAHMPGIEKIAATAGAIVSIGAVAATASANVAARLSREIPSARLLLIGLLVGGPLCAAMALPHGWLGLLVLRMLAGLCLGAAITLTYALGAAIVPAEHRGAAFGWLGLGLQVGTAASPLVCGALAAVSLPGAFVFDGVLAWVAAGLLAFGARGLRSRPAQS